MEVAVVLVLATVAGVAVYRVAMGPPADGYGAVPKEPAPIRRAPTLPVSTLPPDAIVPPAMPNVPMAPVPRTWRTRLAGILGIVILLPLVALVLAAALYQAGHIVRVMLERFANGG